MPISEASQNSRPDRFRSLEDIVIAKLYSFRDVDRQDLISDEVLSNIDWERLKHLALDEDEAQSSALNEQSYKSFLYDYNEYVRMYPGVIPLDLDNLYNAAMAEKAVPYYASVSLASADNAHFNDGVILYGDQIRFRVNAVGELEAEE